MVFQSYALYPHMTVAENIGFHLKIKRLPKAEIAERLREASRLLDLDDYLESQTGEAVGRPTRPRRHGSSHRSPTEGVPDGRAIVEPRRQASGTDTHTQFAPLQQQLASATST